MNIKVSIIIPVYKVEDYIEKCIYSVINQTYCNIECILVDDCSPDKSIEKVKEIISNYSGNIKFKIITHEKNKGLSAARNTGIKESTGDYIYFMDSDDYIISECIEIMVRLQEKYPHVELIQAGAICNLEFLDIEKKDIPFEYTENRRWIKTTLLERYLLPLTSWNKLIKKEFIIKNNLYFKEGIIHEDELFNFYLAKYLSSIAICKINTYVYVSRDNSIMSSKNNKSKESWEIIYKEFINNIDSFCANEQIQLIYKELLPRYVFSFNEEKIGYKKLYLSLSHKTSLIGKLIILFTVYLPYYVIKRKIVYSFFYDIISSYCK